jgi:ADP-ribosylglycohydrolase
VPQAITAFLESRSVVDAIRKAVSIGGDSDTIACIAGGIAQAFYRKIPKKVEEKVMAVLDERLRGIVLEFKTKYLIFT